jgi:hypothetical protein
VENNEPKSSKAIMTFGLLILGSGLATIFLFIIGNKVPEVMDKARIMFAVTSVFGVAFLIYIKEFRSVGEWKELPIALRFIWWTIFVGNTLNFTEYFITTFIIR